MSIEYNGRLISRAKQLRKSMTKQEAYLWYNFLKDYPVRFQRQKVIGNYIVDFYCHKAALVIELDGSQHYSDNGLEYDKIRTEYLHSLNLQVNRYTNTDIEERFRAVCEDIDKTTQARLAGGSIS